MSDEAKSVTRQIEHPKAFAARKGWTVDESCIFVDDGISGAEFATRPGFLRLMNALKPRPPFQVLMMSEESRLGREAIETAYALKQLVTGGVRVFFYLEDRERTLDSPTDKIMLSLTAFADELERDRARGDRVPLRLVLHVMGDADQAEPGRLVHRRLHLLGIRGSGRPLPGRAGPQEGGGWRVTIRLIIRRTQWQN
jgi:hypothetical protein